MKFGIFGGTFNPPHLGHRRALENFIALAKPDRTYVTVAGTPPHKELFRQVKDEERLKMAELAFGDIAQVSDLELRRPGKSYTIDTLEYFAKSCEELCLYMGSDMLLGVENVWYRFEDIFKICTVAVFSRTGEDLSLLRQYAEELKEKYGAEIMVFEAEPVVASSTQIRERLKNEESCEGLLPRAVNQYIKENGLYR